MHQNCRSLRYSWSIACRRCSNYIFILNLTPGFMELGEDSCMTRWETSMFVDLVRLILEILRHVQSDHQLLWHFRLSSEKKPIHVPPQAVVWNETILVPLQAVIRERNKSCYRKLSQFLVSSQAIIKANYRKTSSMSRTKSQNLNVSNLVLQFSLLNPLKPGVKLRMKM